MEESHWSISGCTHYKRRCKFLSPCCRTIYTCRFCHDDKEAHTLDREKVKEIICAKCNKIQPPQSNCEKCGIKFGQYICLECNLFDDYKRQFHCHGCGICRIGGAENFFHCNICNVCLPLDIKTNHKCVENVSRANCPVCLDDLHTSRIPCHIPRCGHLLHTTCFDEVKTAGHLGCPTCLMSWN